MCCLEPATSGHSFLQYFRFLLFPLNQFNTEAINFGSTYNLTRSHGLWSVDHELNIGRVTDVHHRKISWPFKPVASLIKCDGRFVCLTINIIGKLIRIIEVTEAVEGYFPSNLHFWMKQKLENVDDRRNFQSLWERS